jgi:multimeric flavodoxin WrbA
VIPEVRILGVSGSPVKGGNVEALLDKALRSQESVPGVSYEIASLSSAEVGDCIHCNWCLRKQEGDRRCSQDDGMTDMYPRVEAADVLIFATPVYFGRLSGHLAAFIDRLRPYVHGNLSRGMLRNKVGGSIAVAWFRMAGLEMALITMNQFFYAVNMVIASSEMGLQGGSAFSSLGGVGAREGDDRLLVLRDDLGMASAVATVGRAVELARIIKAGTATLG